MNARLIFADVGNPMLVQLFCKKRRLVCCWWLHFVSSGWNVSCFSSRGEPAARRQLSFQYNGVHHSAVIILLRKKNDLLRHGSATFL